MDVEQIVRRPYVKQAGKHGFDGRWVHDQINAMDNVEFLQAVSAAVEERLLRVEAAVKHLQTWGK